MQFLVARRLRLSIRRFMADADRLFSSLQALGFSDADISTALHVGKCVSVEDAADYIVELQLEADGSEEVIQHASDKKADIKSEKPEPAIAVTTSPEDSDSMLAASNFLSSFLSAMTQEEYKMVIVARKDLRMSAGKMAAQCCHGAVSLVMMITETGHGAEALVKWKQMGQAKVVLRADSQQELLDLQKSADSAGIPNYLIRDAGRTQIASGSITVCAIGPASKTDIDRVTGHLKLY